MFTINLVINFFLTSHLSIFAFWKYIWTLTSTGDEKHDHDLPIRRSPIDPRNIRKRKNKSLMLHHRMVKIRTTSKTLLAKRKVPLKIKLIVMELKVKNRRTRDHPRWDRASQVVTLHKKIQDPSKNIRKSPKQDEKVV